MTLIPDLERDLVEAAGRMRTPRGRARRAVPLAAAALAAAVTAIAASGLWSDEEAGDSAAPPAGEGGDTRTTPAPPRRFPPEPNTASPPAAFRFDGVRYSMVGYRSRRNSICVRLTRAGDERSNFGTTCSGERNLRHGLRRAAVLNVGAGVGEHLFLSGFARADTRELTVRGTERRRHVVVTRPWRPRPWKGDPIRAFYAIVDAPPGRDRAAIDEVMRLRVVPAAPRGSSRDARGLGAPSRVRASARS